MTEREVTRAQLEAIKRCSKLSEMAPAPLPPGSVLVEKNTALLEALEVLHSRAGRATPPGIYQEINNHWCLIEHGESELLESLGKAVLDLLSEMAAACETQACSAALLLPEFQQSRLSKAAHRLEQALSRVPGFDRDRLLPQVNRPYPWSPPTLDSVLDDACSRRDT